MSKPNLLYIHTDQHSPHVTGCYGDPLVETPNLDALAKGGSIFTNAYCTSPICVPSRMSMLSGLHPYQNEVWTNRHILNSGIPTHAHALGAAGYQPVLAGRMHALGPDQLHGYVERYVGDHNPNFIGAPGPDRGVLNGTAGPNHVSLEKSGAGQSGYQVHDEYVTAAAIDVLNRAGIARRSGQNDAPFCLTIGYMLPHAPFVARREDFERYASRINLPRIREQYSENLHPHIQWWRTYTNSETVSELEILRARTAYWGLVHRIDVMVGQVMDTLRQNNLLDNTLIVYTSDHGEMVGEHDLWWKHTFYEQSARVPLILNWPGRIDAGQTINAVVSALDVTATLIDAVNGPSLPESSGRSLLPLVDGRTAPDWENVSFSEYCSDEFCPEGGCYQRMIRYEEWKYIYYHRQPPQLFNLAEDPDELHNLAGNLAQREIQLELHNRVLDDWDPDNIAARMTAKRKQSNILEKWALNTNPPEQYRWPLKGEMNWLDDYD
ncbi:MAG: sulfatase-like hydrolase/transferase [Aggregatilineales bacterium]